MRIRCLVMGLAALVVGGCKKEGEAAKEPAAGAMSADAGGVAKPGSVIQTAAEKPKLRGRCENESSDNAFGSLYFYPDKKELFITLDGSAMRLPVVISKEDEKATEFTYKWLDKDKEVTNGTATVSRVGTKKWQFDFDFIKDSICHPVDDELFHKSLTALGVKAGKYLDAKANDMIDVVADAQKIIHEEKGETSIQFYRVRAKSEDAVLTVYTSIAPPSESKPWNWQEMTITTLGDDLVISYSKDLTRRYAPVK